jgi:hypothetical protein
VKGPESFWFLGGWCLNLLSTASLFLGQTPVASNALKISWEVNVEIQADQNNGIKSAFLTGSMPKDFWVKEMRLDE